MIIPLVIVLVSSLGIQATSPEARGQEIRNRVVRAFGGPDSLNRVAGLAYTLERSNHATGQRNAIRYELDFRRRSARRIDGATVVTERDDPALGETLYYNFVNLLGDDSLVFTWLRSDRYRDEPVDVLRVSDPHGSHEPINLFVSANTGLIVTSTSPDGRRYADESEYVDVGHGLRFPLRFRIIENGRLLAEGYFKDLKVGIDD